MLYWERLRNIKNTKIFSPNLTPANFLGLGWAATPAGLKAMEELAKLEEERRTSSGIPKESGRKSAIGTKTITAMPHGAASNEMCTFLILNISSLQLIPVNIIAYRSQYGRRA